MPQRYSATDSLLSVCTIIPPWVPAEHKCSRCEAIMNSNKALKTCFDKHEEVCDSYHPIMHVMGQTHNCKPCKQEKEMLETRRKDIHAMEQRLNNFEGGKTQRKQLEKKLAAARDYLETTVQNENLGREKRRLGYLEYIKKGRTGGGVGLGVRK
ncbi:hypothetical protein RUND412_001471 [Rhizina undulata]